MANLQSLIAQEGNVMVVVSATDLREFATGLISKAVEGYKEVTKEEQYLSTAEVAKDLRVTKPTLWRWANIGYLVPIKVGVKTRYRKSDVDKIKEGK